MIRFKLIGSKRRPAYYLPTYIHLKCLIDSGALITVWCNSVAVLKACYPNASKTSYYTTVSGFGGVSSKIREVWKIPEFEIIDDNGTDKFVIKNLLVAIVDDSQMSSFNMVLTSTVFRGTKISIADFPNDKHFEIESSVDRPVYCIPDEFVNLDKYRKKLVDSFELKEGESLISGTTVFFEE